MTGTITTRAGESQRAHDGLHTFFGVPGADAIGQSPSALGTWDRSRLPSVRQVREAGQRFLSAIFAKSEAVPSSIDGIAMTPHDRAWLARRIERLRPMSDGPMRVIAKDIWNLAAALMRRDRQYIAVWKHFARRCPRDWLADFCGVALLDSHGDMRALDNLRAQSMLAAGVLLWMLAELDPDGDPTDGHYAYVIRGLPYGAFQELLAYFESFGRAQLRRPARTTVWGTHRVGGRFHRAENGYLAAYKQAGLIITKQPCGWDTPVGFRGKPHKNEQGRWECWAFVEIRLRIPKPGRKPQLMGPPPLPIWLRYPPPARPAGPKPPNDRVAEESGSWRYLSPHAPVPVRSSDASNYSEAELISAADARAFLEQLRSNGRASGSDEPVAASDSTFANDPTAVSFNEFVADADDAAEFLAWVQTRKLKPPG
jgi:hypothetical protein